MKRLTTLALVAFAIPGITNAGYVYNVSPGSIRLIGSSGSVAMTPLESSVLSGCSSSDFYVITEANNAKMMLSVLLMAKATGTTVKIYVPDDPTQKCDAATGRPAVVDITLED